MTINQFYDKIQNSLPCKWNPENDFRDEFGSLLKDYIQTVQDLDKDIKLSISNWNELMSDVEQLCLSLFKTVQFYYAGLHAKAYLMLEKEILGSEGKKGLLDKIYLCRIEKDTIFYRARIFENNRKRTYKDMFHIPLKSRGIVSNQRFSVNGYPCLYLGSTIYACWEELNQPKFDDLMISSVKAMDSFSLIDIRIPSREDFRQENLYNLIYKIPLIIACSIINNNNKDIFKPEYIVPQLLTEIIIYKNHRDCSTGHPLKGLILGVIFTSTHINNNFGYNHKVFDNVAIPVIEHHQKGEYCNYLSYYFSLTDPTCYEYETIRKEFDEFTYEKTKGYENSKMFRLEQRINNSKFERFDYFLMQSDPFILKGSGTTTFDIISSKEYKLKYTETDDITIEDNHKFKLL